MKVNHRILERHTTVMVMMQQDMMQMVMTAMVIIDKALMKMVLIKRETIKMRVRNQFKPITNESGMRFRKKNNFSMRCIFH